MKFLCRHIGILTVCTAGAFAAMGGDAPSVKGRVLTEGGEPMADASVYLESQESPATGRPIITKTDQAGFYEVSLKKAGAYVIHAFKDEAGYPDIVFAFNLAPNQVLPKVSVKRGQNLTGIDVKLGPKSGTFHFRVIDKKTGQILALADYKPCQVRAPTYCIDSRAAGGYDFLVPSTDITIQVSSQGYANAAKSGLGCERHKPVGHDYDGDTASLVTTIRKNASLPCVDHVPQTMYIVTSCATPIPYYSNVQTVTISATTVSNCRGGVCDTFTY